ncbi:hypothetical protein ACFE04_003943 [Oxalis oulophora]
MEEFTRVGEKKNYSSCFRLPPYVNSGGISEFTWFDYSMPRFEFVTVFVIFVSQAFHMQLRRFGLPVFLSQLIAGILLVELLKRMLPNDDSEMRAREDSIQLLGTIATIGYASCTFQIGVKTDLGMIKRAGKKAVYLGCFPIIVSVLCGILTAYFTYNKGEDIYQGFFFFVIMTSATSFPVVTSLLEDLNIVNSELRRIGQSAALISDVLSMIMINSTITMMLYAKATYITALKFFGFTLAFLFVIVFIIRPAMKWIVRHTPTYGRVKEIYMYSVISIFLAVTATYGFHDFSLGPYILGLAIPTGPPLASAIAEKFDGLNSGLFMPLFIATCGMRLELGTFVSDSVGTQIGNLTVIGLTYLAKFGASFTILWYARVPKRDSCVLALIMCVKGFVELGNISFLNDSQVIKNDLLCLMWFVLVIIGCFTPILVKYLHDPSRRFTAYERNTVMHLAPNSNLQILTCIHVPNHISAVTNLLEASGASMQRPIGIHVLHMIKLSGQAAPVFISHDKNKLDFSDNCSYSENVVLSFTKFEANNRGSISVNICTTISSPNLMHEDVCSLALDISASLIILPFHRTWYLDGSVESDDNFIRVLNRMVLDTAPSSVGILVDRGYKRRPISMDSSSGHLTQDVAMIFLGGADDREALFYAMRMAEDPNVRLTVISLTAKDDGDNTSWAKVLDAEVLKDVTSIRHIRYVEHEVKDGRDTSMIVQSMMKEFDFFIIGRAENLECQQTAGLAEWMEYPELGIIGDLLAARDVEDRFSFLVVQQQQQRHLMKSL